MSGSVHPSDEALWLDEPSAHRHVEQCTTCRHAQASARRRQQQVAGMLAAATPASTRMPTTVQRRLTTALDQAALDHAAIREQGHPPDQATEVRPSRRTSVLAGLAAAAAVLVLAAVIGIQQTSDPVADGSAGEQPLAEAPEAGQAPSDAALSGTADSDAAPAPPPIPPPLLDEAQRTAAGRTEVATTCGVGVLDDRGDAVVAVDEVTTDPRGGVLVTVEQDAGQVVWWLPSCTAGPDEALGRSPVP